MSISVKCSCRKWIHKCVLLSTGNSLGRDIFGDKIDAQVITVLYGTSSFNWELMRKVVCISFDGDVERLAVFYYAIEIRLYS